MQKKKYIAITGGIGSGKSTVCQLLKKYGYPVFSCDEIYRALLISPAFVQKIGAAFPSALVNGTIDRSILSKIVFQDQEALARLNALTHPAVMDELDIQMQAIVSPLVFAEVPLLYEGGFDSRFDLVLIVERDKNARIQAVMSRDRKSEEEVLQRIVNQTDHSKIPESDRVFKLKNDGNMQTLENNLNEFLQKF